MEPFFAAASDFQRNYRSHKIYLIVIWPIRVQTSTEIIDSYEEMIDELDHEDRDQDFNDDAFDDFQANGLPMVGHQRSAATVGP